MKKSMLFFVGIIAAISAWIPSAQAASYTLANVQAHNTAGDCWTIVGTNVYNLTSFIAGHPGGAGTISSICGIDGTAAFGSRHGSSSAAQSALASLLIGNLTTADIVAPSVPSSLLANPVSASQINLSWTASTDNVAVTGYNVYRDGALLATTTANNFSNIGLAPSVAYSYNVTAFDAAHNYSALSVTTTASTFATSSDAIAPSVPAGLALVTSTPTQIILTWATSTDNVGVAGYNIYRGASLIGTSAINSFTNSGLAPDTAYSYTITAFDLAGNTSTSSASLTVTTPAKPANINNLCVARYKDPKKLKECLRESLKKQKEREREYLKKQREYQREYQKKQKELNRQLVERARHDQEDDEEDGERRFAKPQAPSLSVDQSQYQKENRRQNSPAAKQSGRGKDKDRGEKED